MQNRNSGVPLYFDRVRFFLRDEYVYEIKEGFPRIVSEDIPNNVFDVAYSIDVEACEKWRVSKNSVLGQL